MTALIAVHLWQSTLVLVAAWLATFFYRRNPAEARFLIWCGASLKFLVPLAVLQWLGDWLGQSLPQPLAVDRQLIEAATAIFTPALPNPMGLSHAACSWLAVLAATIWVGGSLLLAWRCCSQGSAANWPVSARAGGMARDQRVWRCRCGCWDGPLRYAMSALPGV